MVVGNALHCSMSPSSDQNDEFLHQIAIKLSRALNLINPNDLLAERVIDIAKTNSVDGFAKGESNTYLESSSKPMNISRL